MFTFLAGCQTGLFIAWLLAAAVVLSFVTLILRGLIRLALTPASPTYDARGRKKEDDGCCSLPLILLMVLGFLCYKGYGLVADMVEKGEVAELVFSMHDTEADEFGVISVFQKERVNLYQYYTELKLRRKQCEEYIDELESRRAELSYQKARDALTQEIRSMEAEVKSINNILGSIEEVAGRIYFTRLMQNLGVNTDTRGLDGEMDNVQRQSEHAMMKQLNIRK